MIREALYEWLYSQCSDLRNFPIIYIGVSRGASLFLSVRYDTTGQFINGKNFTCYYYCDGGKPEPLTEMWWQLFTECSNECQKLLLEKDDNPQNFNWFKFNKQAIHLARMLKNELENECHVIYILPDNDDYTIELQRIEIMGNGILMPLKYNKVHDEWVYDNPNKHNLSKFE